MSTILRVGVTRRTLFSSYLEREWGWVKEVEINFILESSIINYERDHGVPLSSHQHFILEMQK